MRLKRIILLSLCFALLLSAGMSACSKQDPETDTPAPGTTADTGTTPESSTKPEGESGSEPAPGPDDPDYIEPVITGPYAQTIMQANSLADGVQAYYLNPLRTAYRIENQNMHMDYAISLSKDMLVSKLTNAKGQVYLENDMDVFVTMSDGNTYFASQSTSTPYTNIYRMSYYYYDVHIMGQNFMGGANVTDEMDFAITKANVRGHDVSNMKVANGEVSFVAAGADPYVYTAKSYTKPGLHYEATQYNAIQFTAKTTATAGYLYFIAGDRDGHNGDQCVRFELQGDNEWHTYTVVLDTAPDYTGKVSSLRFDIGEIGDTVTLKDIKAVKLDTTAPAILLDRTFHTYSDKMNQVLHFVASKDITGIASLGMITKIPTDTVDKLIIKDAKGTHTSLDGVDFDSCEYVGFDIGQAGVLGFILLPHENSGRLEVKLADGVYTVTQTSCPEGGELHHNSNSTEDDFYMGHRLYTDDSHSFDAFLTAAEQERHPLDSVGGESYLGYDALRGAYRYSIGGTDFNVPFFSEQNRHYSADISVTATESDRNIYVYTYFRGGEGENALILGKNDMLLPIPVMICKNFRGENEEPVYDPGDPSYSETYFPISVKAGETVELTVLNLYMNWGKIPLKQLSSIQFFWPYYHLSLGTTETSCINPLYGARDLWTLPDFRSMSMPYWFELPKGEGYSNQPQHTHGGFQYFLQYTDANGNYSATENYHNNINSSGPVYTDVKMDYISDDGKIKVSYNHMELPETDELRAYYEINYEVLEDISIADFAKDFSFYSLEGYAGAYTKIGYLNQSNQIVQGAVNASDSPEVIKLGDQYPYVSLYKLHASDASWENNNVNLGFIIYDSEMTIGGEKCDAGFVIVGQNSKYSLSLDLADVTLKAGDKMKLCLIISPWGFHTSTDDSNMQEIRRNTCLEGVKLTVQEGTAMNSVYLPMLKSENGKSAEFTISGGSNNKAVRIYGFEKLTVPVIYEKIDGQWVELTINSSQTPDSKGYSHYYDGYAVYYDRDGTYSYAFAFNMDDAQSRSFRIECQKDFTSWPETDHEEDKSNNMSVLVDAKTLQGKALGAQGIGKVELAADESYVRIYGAGDGSGEAYFAAYMTSNMLPTGRYLAIKYRIPTSNPEALSFEFFTSTVHSGAQAGESFAVSAPIADGAWHVLIVNMAEQGLPTFEADSEGFYTALHLRFDIFNTAVSAQTYVDIAYVGMCDQLSDICELQQAGVGEMYRGGALVGVLDFSTGELQKPQNSQNPEDYVDPASGWTVSNVRYSCMVDYINGMGDGDGAYDACGGNSNEGIEFFAFNAPTVDGGKLALTGWAIAQGGIDRYMWSADGGRTWQECTLYGRDSFQILKESDGIAKAANAFFASTGYDVMEHPDKIVFQGNEGVPSGVTADLSAYAGQTLDVLFALVPLDDPDGLCIIAVVCDVQVES